MEQATWAVFLQKSPWSIALARHRLRKTEFRTMDIAMKEFVPALDKLELYILSQSVVSERIEKVLACYQTIFFRSKNKLTRWRYISAIFWQLFPSWASSWLYCMSKRTGKEWSKHKWFACPKDSAICQTKSLVSLRSIVYGSLVNAFFPVAVFCIAYGFWEWTVRSRG